MKTQTHPTAEDLLAYLENPEANVFTDISIHLAYCHDCRNQVAKLSALEEAIKQDGVALFRYTGDKNIVDKSKELLGLLGEDTDPPEVTLIRDNVACFPNKWETDLAVDRHVTCNRPA